MSLFVGWVIGLVLGLTGAGGSVFAVPLLILLLGTDVKLAMGLSLGAVAISALFGVFSHIKSGQITWLPALIFSILGASVAPIGYIINQELPSHILLYGFSALVLVIAIRMWRQATINPDASKFVRSHREGSKQSPPLCQLKKTRLQAGLPCLMGLALGAVLTGILSGTFGVGGGFLIVPSLVLLTGLPIKQSVATSLFVIACISSIGFITYLLGGDQINMTLLILLALGGITGMTMGIPLSRLIAGPILQKTFSISMLLMAALTLWQQTT